jgi:uncharacterized membrane protein YeaQ/YmgE (transglycosylase-associated protein family)
MTRRGKRPSIGNPKNFLTVLIKMILIFGVGIIGGLLVDDYFKREWPIFAVIFGLMGAFIASFMYTMYKETINDGDEEE